MKFQSQEIDSTFNGERGEILFNGEKIGSLENVELAESTIYVVSNGNKAPVRHWVDVKIQLARIDRDHMDLFGNEKTPNGGLKIADTNVVHTFTIIANGILLNDGTYKTATVSEVYFDTVPPVFGRGQLSGRGNNVKYTNR